MAPVLEVSNEELATLRALVADAGQGRVAKRGANAQSDAEKAVKSAMGLNDEKKHRLGEIIADVYGEADAREFMEKVQEVDTFVYAVDKEIAAASLYKDVEYPITLANDRYRITTGMGFYLHNGAFVPLKSGVQLQLYTAQMEVSRGKDRQVDNFVKYLKGNNRAFTDAHFNQAPTLYGGTLDSIWKELHPNGMRWHEVFRVLAMKPKEELTVKFLKNGLVAPAEGVVTVNATLVMAGFEGFIRKRS